MPRIDTLDERLRSVESDAIKAANESAHSDDPIQLEARQTAGETLKRMMEMYESVGVSVESLSATVRFGIAVFRSEVTMSMTGAEMLMGSAESQQKRNHAELLELRRSEIEASFTSDKVDWRGRSECFHRPAWLQALLELDSKGKSEAALDELFDRIDELLSTSEYKTVDIILANMPLEGPSLTLMMGLLSITRPAAKHLPSRVRYFNRVYRLCMAMRRDAESLLRGLK